MLFIKQGEVWIHLLLFGQRNSALNKRTTCSNGADANGMHGIVDGTFLCNVGNNIGNWCGLHRGTIQCECSENALHSVRKTGLFIMLSACWPTRELIKLVRRSCSRTAQDKLDKKVRPVRQESGRVKLQPSEQAAMQHRGQGHWGHDERVHGTATKRDATKCTVGQELSGVKHGAENSGDKGQ